MHWVLVHGAWHGAWCWQRLEDELHARHITCSTNDLPGHGDDTTPREQINIDTYVDYVCRWIRELDRRVVLVGHSMAGAIITRVAELLPGYIDSLVYVAAFMPRNGESLTELGLEDADSELNPAIRRGDEPGTVVVDETAAEHIFYHDCRQEDASDALARLTPQPLGAFAQPVHSSEQAWGSVPRGYVLCRQDRAITPAMQRRMLERVPCDPVVELDSGHSPFLSNPAALADAIYEITAAHAER